MKVIIDAGIVMLLFFTPLIRTRQLTFDGVFLPKEIFIAIIVSLILIVFLLNQGSEKRRLEFRTPLDIPVLVYLAANVISSFFAVSKYLAVQQLVFTVSTIALFFVITRHVRSMDQAKKIIFAVVMSALAVSLYGMFQFIQALTHFTELKLVSFKSVIETTLGGTNLTAQFLMVAIFLSVSLMLTAARGKYLLLAACVFIFFTFLFTLSRGAYVGLLAGVAVSVFFASIMKAPFLTQTDYKWLKSAVISLAVVLIAFGVFSSIIVRKDIRTYAQTAMIRQGDKNYVEGKIEPTAGMDDSIFGQTSVSFKLRLNWWKNAARMIRDYPFFGVGPGNFGVHHFKYRTVSESDIPSTVRLTSPHSDYLHIMSETGIPGIAAFAFIVALFFKKAAKDLAATDREKIILSLAVVGAVTSTLTQGIYDFNLHNPVPSIVFWSLAGVFFSPALSEVSKEGVKASVRFEIARYAMMITAVMIIFFSALTLSHEIHTMKGVRKFHEKNYSGSVAEYSAAIGLMPGDFKTYIFLGRLYEAVKDYDKAAHYIEKGLALYPYYYSFYENLGEIYFNKGEYKKAEENYLKALGIYPKYSQAYYDLAFLYEATGQKERAEKEIEEGFSRSAKGAWDWNLMGALLLKIGKHKEAMRNLNMAKSIDPNNPYVLYNFSYACFFNGKRDEAV
ncbi:MAG: O-antigen ligase family protein, partial [bacterium]